MGVDFAEWSEVQPLPLGRYFSDCVGGGKRATKERPFD